MCWPQFARQLYGNVLSVREKDYVEAAVAIGEKNGRLMRKYIPVSYTHLRWICRRS